LITQCANVFTKVELVQALEKLIKPERLEAELVKTAVKKMKEVATDVIGAGISELNAVNRHPVILIADKVRLTCKSNV
jgi:microcompartment protein CcmK/EutM